MPIRLTRGVSTSVSLDGDGVRALDVTASPLLNDFPVPVP
jgi:hypothetical protein